MTEGERGRHGDQPAEGDHTGDAANQQPVGGTEWLLQQLGGGRLKNFFDQTSTGVQQRLTEENAEASETEAAGSDTDGADANGSDIEGADASSTHEAAEGADASSTHEAAEGDAGVSDGPVVGAASDAPGARTSASSDPGPAAPVAPSSAPSWASPARRAPAADTQASEPVSNEHPAAPAADGETDAQADVESYDAGSSAAPGAGAAPDDVDGSASNGQEPVDWARPTRDGGGDEAPDWVSTTNAIASERTAAGDGDQDPAPSDWASPTRGSTQDSPWWLASGSPERSDDTENAAVVDESSTTGDAEFDDHVSGADGTDGADGADGADGVDGAAGTDAGAGAAEDAGAPHAHDHGVHARDTAPVDPYAEALAATGAIDPMTAPRADARPERDSTPPTDDPERVYAWPSEDDPWKEGPVWPDDEAAPAESDEIGSGFSWNLRPSDDVDPLVAARDADSVGGTATYSNTAETDGAESVDATDVVEAEIVEDEQPVAAEADAHFLAIPVSDPSAVDPGAVDPGADDGDAREIDDVATEFIPARSAFDTQLQEQFDEEAVTQAHPVPEGFGAAPAAAHVNHGSAATAAAAAAAGAPAAAKTARSATGAAYGDRGGADGDGGTGPSWVVPSARPAGPPRGLVIAAVIVAAIVVFGALFFLGTRIGMASQSAAPATSETPAASPEPSVSAEPTPELPTVGPLPAGTYDWNQLLGGECIDPFTDQWAESFTVVDCGAPHAAQLVKTASVSDDPAAALPAEADLAAQVSGFCQAPGVIDLTAAAAIGDVQVRTSYPLTQEQWDAGQRSYYCFLDRASAEPITGTLVPAAG